MSPDLLFAACCKGAAARSSGRPWKRRARLTRQSIAPSWITAAALRLPWPSQAARAAGAGAARAMTAPARKRIAIVAVRLTGPFYPRRTLFSKRRKERDGDESSEERAGVARAAHPGAVRGH